MEKTIISTNLGPLEAIRVVVSAVQSVGLEALIVALSKKSRLECFDCSLRNVAHQTCVFRSGKRDRVLGWYWPTWIDTQALAGRGDTGRTRSRRDARGSEQLGPWCDLAA